MTSPSAGRREKTLYGSDHGKLNITLPAPTMWMNMGFWKDTEDFPTACQALLEEVLKRSGILRDDGPRVDNVTSKTLSIIDLGFGCGDQSVYMKNALSPQRSDNRGLQSERSLRSYVGITLDARQFDHAQERLDREKTETDPSVNIYCADASRPEAWSAELKKDVDFACHSDDEKDVHENWIMGLDTLYHFRPSKWPVIDYASSTLGASLMAFDLCVADNLSLWQRFILRIMAFLGHSPFSNWVTMEEYRDRLVAAGYDRNKIEIHDISEHVFRPLARFLRRREVELKRYGLSIGRFRHGAAMFDWWGRAGIVQGCIIVARK